MNRLAEENVIGSLLIDENAISRVSNVLSAEMFADELLGRIYLEIQRFYDNGKRITLPQILQNLSDYPQEVVANTIKECTLKTITSATIKENAEVIINEHKAFMFGEAINKVKIAPDKVNAQIGQLITDLESLQDNKSTNIKDLSQITAENKDKYFTELNIKRTNIGFTELDNLLGGLEGGDVITIGARPAVGKSAFSTQIAKNVASTGKKVCYINLEMSEKQMYERFVVSLSGIDMTRLKRARCFVGDEKKKFEDANNELEKSHNLVISTGSKSVSEIRAEVRHMDYDLIIIDYLQLLKSDVTYKGNRYAEVGAISKAIKALAMELNIPIITLSQLNRLSENSKSKEPTMAELRESGDLEQDSSVIILLWNIEPENPKIKGCKIEKNRQGRTGKVKLEFDGERMQFKEMDSTDWVTVTESDDCPFK